jgi:hypothetical protein
MNTREFVAAWKREKALKLDDFLGASSTAAVAAQIRAMELKPAQLEQLHAVFDCAITDIMYALLLALDGEASIGGVQELYELKAEDGTVLTGHIEEEAWAQFHGAI